MIEKQLEKQDDENRKFDVGMPLVIPEKQLSQLSQTPVVEQEATLDPYVKDKADTAGDGEVASILRKQKKGKMHMVMFSDSTENRKQKIGECIIQGRSCPNTLRIFENDLSMQQPFHYPISQQNKEPPPYPGHVYTRGFQHNAGYRQSYASSETGSTDLSLSSCENLSTSLRQDPQGEETQHANMFPGSVEIHHPTYPNPYIQGSATGVEVKTANSSTFYVTGSVPNEVENVSLSGYSAPRVTTQSRSDTLVQQGGSQQEPYKPYQQSYQNQYYNDVNSQHQNRQVFIQPSSDNQSHDHNTQNRHLQSDYLQNVQYQQQGDEQYGGNQSNQNDTPTSTTSSQQNTKQDQFKKWRHFYVNEKTPLQQYRQLTEDSETPPEDDHRTPNKYSGKVAPEYSENTKLHDKPIHCESKSLRSLENGSSSSFGHGSMIAKLKQEFCKDNPPDHRWNSISKTIDLSERTAQSRVTNDRMRSATPDFLTDRPDFSKQLPLRPSSANSRQTCFQRQNLPLVKSKLENQNMNDRSKSVCDKKKKSPDVVRKQTLSLFNQEEKFQEEAKSHSKKFMEKSQKEGSNSENSIESPAHARMSQWKDMSDDEDTARNPLSSPIFNSVSKDSPNMVYEPVNDISGAGPQTELLHPGVSAKNHTVESQLGSEKVREKFDSGVERSDRNSLDRCRASELDHAAIATRATQMVERLSAENSSLRQELEGYYSKVCRLQKFEVEIQKITDAYESLVKHSTKRENLDKVMRLRLETEVKKLRENNHDLKDQLEKALCKVDQCGAYALGSDSDVKKEVREKDGMITKLIIQSRELSKSRDKLEVELATQKACCEEHQNHVHVLEASLKLVHAEKFNLQGEVQKLKLNESKMKQLQQAFSHLQNVAENQEAIEHKLRGKLEEEIRTLKHQKKVEAVHKASDTDEGISSDCESGPRVSWMKQQIRELKESVLRLEVEVAHYQQRYIEEQALRQLALNAASMPKDVKIAALEQSSHETERLISESKAERLQHLEELYNANRKSAEFEAKVKTLEARLFEKDAMIRVLQKHTLSLSRTSSVSSLFTSPLHSPHQSVSSPVRHNTALDLPVSPALSHKDFSRLAIHHNKSSSDGAVLDMSGVTPNTLCTPNESKERSKTNPVSLHKPSKSLRELLTAQAEIFQRWKTEDPGDVSKECWQV